MNLFANVSNRKGRGIVGAMICLSISLIALTAQAGPATSSNRFLFVIDTSAAMKPLESKLRETLFDFVYSGVRGRMTNGDTYGIWLVNGTNDTSFAMESWKKQFVVEIAAKAVTHMKDHGLKGKAHLELAMADLQQVIKNIGDLTVILVTDGSTPIMGTPFDDQINARWREIAPALKRAKSTLNTVLVARDGEFVAWAANSPEFMVEIPVLPPKPAPPAPVAAAPTKATVQTELTPVSDSPGVTAIESVAAPKPRISSTPIIITKESIAEERRSYLPSTAHVEAPTPAADVVATNPVPEVAASRPVTNVAAVATTSATNAAVPNNVAQVTPDNSSPVISPKASAPLSSMSTAPVVAPSQTAATKPASFESKTSWNAALLWAGVGAGGMLVCVLLVMFLLRRGRREPSLISQALVRGQFSIH